METIVNDILPIVQIIIAVLLIISVLLQQTGAGLGNGLGGADSSNIISTRRGFEKTLLKFTIFLSILFFATAVLALVGPRLAA